MVKQYTVNASDAGWIKTQMDSRGLDSFGHKSEHNTTRTLRVLIKMCCLSGISIL